MKVQALEVWFFTVIATCRAAIPVFKTSSDINQATKKTVLTHFDIKSADTQSATETLVQQKALPHTDTLIPTSSLIPGTSILQLYSNMNQVNPEDISLPFIQRRGNCQCQQLGETVLLAPCVNLKEPWNSNQGTIKQHAKLDTSFPFLHQHQHVPASSTISQQALTAFCLRLCWLGCEVLTQVR